MDSVKAFDQAMQVEVLAAEIYEGLARRFPPQSGLFGGLAAEEREHASRIGMLRSMYLKSSRDFRGMTGTAVDFGALLAEASAFQAQLASPSLGLDAALGVAVAFEERMAVCHAQILSRGADPGIKALFDLLASQDREHKKLLLAAKK